MQTVLLVPVVPHGVLQLGSLDTVRVIKITLPDTYITNHFGTSTISFMFCKLLELT